MNFRKTLSALLCMLLCLSFSACGSADGRLSNNQVQELRKEYPLVFPQIQDIATFSLRENLQLVHCFARITITKVLPPYTVNFTSEGTGLETELTFAAFSATVEEVYVNNLPYEPAKEITLSIGTHFMADYPALYEGLALVCGLEEGEGAHKGKYTPMAQIIYYVTKEGAVLSAYKEYGNDNFTGMKKEQFQKAVGKMEVTYAGEIRK